MAATITNGSSVAPPSQQQKLPVLTPSEKFFRYFQNEVTDLQADIDRLSSHSTTGGERSDAVDHALAAIARLGTEVKNASSYLPAYDQRTYNEAVKALGVKLAEAREKFAPRQKFSFKKRGQGREGGLGSVLGPGRKNESAISLEDAATLADERRQRVPGFGGASVVSSFANTPADTPSPAPEGAELNSTSAMPSPAQTTDTTSTTRIRQPSFSHSTSITISNHTGLRISLPSAASHATSSSTLSHLRRCVVDLSQATTSQPFAGLTLKDIEDSIIVCGRVEGAAHLTGLKRCVVVVQSRQVRMHESVSCDVYLATASRPIIEDCSGIRFGPLPGTYGGEGGEDGQWRMVDDFKWLRKEASPNWRVLEPGERVEDGVWRRLRELGPDLGVDEVLNVVGLPA